MAKSERLIADQRRPAKKAIIAHVSGETKRRVAVPFDADLRRVTEEAVHALAEIVSSGRTPPPTTRRERCRACSLLEHCRPDAVQRPVRTWRSRMVESSLATESAP